MSDKKYVVPEAMTEAAREHIRDNGGTPLNNGIRLVLEAAVRWLAENPVVPTHEQIDAMQESCDLPNFAHRGFEVICATWQRRMFLAPELPFDPTLGGHLCGRTWTQEQADKLIDNIKTATHCYVEPRARVTEPVVPEAVDALMWDSNPTVYFSMPEARHNSQILEAYNLGLKAGK